MSPMLLMQILLFLAMFLSSMADRSYRQATFRLAAKGARLVTNVISDHNVVSSMDCSHQCLQKRTCVAFNYRVTKPKRNEPNCQLTNTTKGFEERDVNNDVGDWKFYKILAVLSPHCSCVRYVGNLCVLETECKNPKFLGMENRQILDSQIMASSEWDGDHGAINGRLNFQAHGSKTGGWTSKNNDLNQWLQVDFEQQTVVIGISTQGRGNCRCNQWVKSYTISCSNDGIHFQEYKRTGLVQVFPGNSDEDSVVHNVLSPAITATFIRVKPKSWNEYISMRVDFNGCY